VNAEHGTVPFRVALPVWTRVALLSFGGPAGQIAVMHRILVEERRWVGESRFLHCMSYCMLLPGPEAQQLATYLGWILHGTRGGLVAGLLFVAPGFLSLLVLSILYAQFRDTTLLEGVFFGLKPAVAAVVLQALLRIGRRALVGWRSVAIAAAAFMAIFFFQVPFPWIVAGAAIAGWLTVPHGAQETVTRAPALAPPSWLRAAATAAFWLAVWFLPVAGLAALFGPSSIFLSEALFFSKAAVVTFGGAYAVLSYVAQQAVEVRGWLAAGEMLDGLGMAETTPGPLIQVVQFVGYMAAFRNPGELAPLAAGVLGSIVTAWVTFVPCFLFVFVGAPFAEHLRGRPALGGALSAITAAIVGVILNLTVWFTLHTIFTDVGEVTAGPLRILWPDWSTLSGVSLVLAVGAGVALLRFSADMLPTLFTAALLGLAWRIATRG